MSSGQRWGRTHLCAVFVFGFIIAWSEAWVAPADGIARVLAGSQSEGTSFIALWFHVLVFMGAALVTNVAFTDGLDGAIYPELIRIGTVRRWLARWAGRAALYSAISVACLISGVVAASLLSARAQDHAISWQGFDRVVLFAVVVGSAQGLFYWAMMAATTLATGRIQAALPITGATLLCLLPQLRSDWSPIGAASIPFTPPGIDLVGAPLLSLVLGVGVAALVSEIATSWRDVQFI